MPTYEYKCDACGHAFEKFQSMTASPVKKCPVCGKSKVRRLISAGAGLIFKGSGFYITDYRDKAYSDKAKADTADGGAGNKSGESKDAKSGADAPAGSTPAPTGGDSKATPANTTKSEPAPKSDSKPSSGHDSGSKGSSGGGDGESKKGRKK